MSKHTPGPWIQSGRGIWVETDPGCGGPEPQPPEGEQIGDFNEEADARLAAAAPEMREVMAFFDGFYTNTSQASKRLQAALAKARALLAKIDGGAE